MPEKKVTNQNNIQETIDLPHKKMVMEEVKTDENDYDQVSGKTQFPQINFRSPS